MELTFKNELKELSAMSKQLAKQGDVAVSKARLYVDYAIETRNLDLLRVLFVALSPIATMQTKYVAWLKTCVPVKKITKKDAQGNKSISFKIDKKAVRRVSWTLQNIDCYEAGFLAWKSPKKEKPALSLEALLEMVQKRIDSTLDTLEEREEEDAVELTARLTNVSRFISDALGSASDASNGTSVESIVRSVQDAQVWRVDEQEEQAA